MTISPDSDWEAQNHDSNNQDVGNTIQKHHQINQGLLLNKELMNEEVLDKHKICAEELPQFEKNIWNLLGKMSFCVETKLAFRSVWLHNRTFVFDHVKKRYL